MNAYIYLKTRQFKILITTQLITMDELNNLNNVEQKK